MIANAWPDLPPGVREQIVELVHRNLPASRDADGSE